MLFYWGFKAALMISFFKYFKMLFVMNIEIVTSTKKTIKSSSEV